MTDNSSEQSVEIPQPKPRRGRPPKAPELTTPTETVETPPTKDDIKRAKDILARVKQERKDKPKRKCSEKQLAALAAGRAKNPRLNKKKENPEL